ncbi:MAG: hypothetical protein FJ280_13550 [Planctomycetes bacterium]|nr:hypothetical protein [Planctomycetota bacterium]
MVTGNRSYWEFGIKPWDIAAGGLLGRKAGGRATSTTPDEDCLPTGTIVAAGVPLIRLPIWYAIRRIRPVI